ncbi:MAG: S8 family serine peptidase, partial [Candidatus Thorarchaeota archaeon]
YGYSYDDPSTSDSSPQVVPHGTLVANLIASNSPSAVIVNAKVISAEGLASPPAIAAAVDWAVDQGCSVINLSLGGPTAIGDSSVRAVERAFRRGVVVVASAGNAGDGGIAGSSISSPSISQYAISVGALDYLGRPAQYSSLGPTRWRYMKPDIMAEGYTSFGSNMYEGTSFAAPRVAAAAAELVTFLRSRGATWTPGLVMAALMKGASPIAGYPEYQVGAGKLDLQNSRNLVESIVSGGSRSALAYVAPAALPLDFERLFRGDIYSFNLNVITSGILNFSTSVSADPEGFVTIPTQFQVNQTILLPVTLDLTTGPTTRYKANITLSADGLDDLRVVIDQEVVDPIARVAFDLAHTSWDIDSTYGQFKELYIELVTMGISVTELTDMSVITLPVLSEFDAVIILDPCVWNLNDTDPFNPYEVSIRFSESERDAYRDYFLNGGGIFVAALSNRSLDVDSLNEFLQWSGFSLNYDTIATAQDDPVLVTTLMPHPVTVGVSSFDYLGASINVPVGGTVLATHNTKSVLGCLENAGGGRIVVSGTNFFIDNWGMRGQYSSLYDRTLAMNIVRWILQI